MFNYLLVNSYNPVVATMDNGIEYVHAEIYESSEVELFAQSSTEEPQNLTFLILAMAEYLKSVIPGKKILDIGCGTGNWSYRAALCGAKSVDGFDISKEMYNWPNKLLHNLVQSI